MLKARFGASRAVELLGVVMSLGKQSEKESCHGRGLHVFHQKKVYPLTDWAPQVKN